MSFLQTFATTSPLGPVIASAQEALQSSGETLHEVQEVFNPQADHPKNWPHWTVLVLGANAAVSAINTVVQAIFQNIPQAIISGISAVASVLGAITLYAFTPLQSLGGYVEQLAARTNHMSAVIRRLHSASEQLRITQNELQERLQQEKLLAEQQKKSLHEATDSLTQNVQALQKAESQTLSLEQLIANYSSRSSSWSKKFEEFMSASNKVETSHEQLNILLQGLQSGKKEFESTVTALDKENESLKRHSQDLAAASEQFRGLSIQLATLLIDIRKERNAFEEQLKRLQNATKQAAVNIESISTTTGQLDKTTASMQQNLTQVNQLVEIGKMVAKAEEIRKKQQESKKQ